MIHKFPELITGGVGPMTVAMLLKNCCESAFKSAEVGEKWNIRYLPLDLKVREDP